MLSKCIIMYLLYILFEVGIFGLPKFPFNRICHIELVH